MNALLLTDSKDIDVPKIVDLPASKQAGGIHQVEFNELSNIKVWMFLCSHCWDTCVINVTKGIPYKEIIPFIKVHVKNVILKKGTYSDEVLEFLTQYFPDKAGKIRRAHMLGRDIYEVVGI